jgi:Zn-dependent protease
MNLLEPAPTPYDLRWRMFGVAVRVHPMFWLISAIFGWNLSQGPNGLVRLLIWILVCFVSILLHEFGHVWMGQIFGSFGHIVLYSFGGLAIGSNNLYRRWQRILVLLAGPGIQLLLWASLLALLDYEWSPIQLSPSTSPELRLFLLLLISVNLYWPMLNLLPILPLDGGQISREVCEGGLGASRGVIVSLWISFLTAVSIAVYSLLIALRVPVPVRLPFLSYPDPYLIIFFAMLAFSSWQALQAQQPRRRYDDDNLPWER